MIGLSWGLGLQSTCALEMSIEGDLPKLDVAIFANTGFEKDESYQIFDFYGKRASMSGIKVIRIDGQNIFSDHFKKRSVPMYVYGSGRQLKRQCTREYKIRPIQRVVRNLLNMPVTGRTAIGFLGAAELWLGITVDEIERAAPSDVGYIVNRHPFLELGWHRRHCHEYLETRGLPIPVKSSCKFCPYQSIQEWRKLSASDRGSILGLEQHINDNGLVVLDGQVKRVSFLPNGSLKNTLEAGYQPSLFEGCDTPYCNF
jgi:hypothetical protein